MTNLLRRVGQQLLFPLAVTVTLYYVILQEGGTVASHYMTYKKVVEIKVVGRVGSAAGQWRQIILIPTLRGLFGGKHVWPARDVPGGNILTILLRRVGQQLLIPLT